jgi:Cft2 family RNA processing exonuclease
MKLLVPGTKVHLDDHLTVTPFSAGHILGAVGFIFEYRGERYVITGDISLKNHGFVSRAEVPEFPRTRLLVRESTYVGQLPTKTRLQIEQEFIASIRDVLKGGGRVIIPTLAIDRMAEIFALIQQSGLESRWPLRVVGGTRPTEIYYEHAPRARVLGSMRRFENRYEQSSAQKSGDPLIVLASSGMLANNTPSYAWATEVLGDSSSAIFMVNWQDPCTPGGAILKGQTDEEVVLPTGAFSRKCRVERFDFSSHAKEDEMSVIEERLKPDVIVHVHGENARIDEFLAGAPDRSRRHKAQVGATLKL